MSDEPTETEFHEVSNQEADEIIKICKHAVPHNEAIGRVLRNIYSRLKTAEKEITDLETSKSERSRT
jgi:hypothetical protein